VRYDLNQIDCDRHYMVNKIIKNRTPPNRTVYAAGAVVPLACVVKTLQLAEAKTHFSSILKDVEAGNEVAIAYGKKKRLSR
jgi:hypothetical protein